MKYENLFSVSKNGYSANEVDEYISRLQKEYSYVLKFSEALESRLESVESQLKKLRQDIASKQAENDELYSHCVVLSNALKEISEAKSTQTPSVSQGAPNNADEISIPDSSDSAKVPEQSATSGENNPADAQDDLSKVKSEADTIRCIAQAKADELSEVLDSLSITLKDISDYARTVADN